MTRAQALASEAIALTPSERAEVAVAILDSLDGPVRSDAEVQALLQKRSADLTANRDRGLSFEDVFGEPL